MSWRDHPDIRRDVPHGHHVGHRHLDPRHERGQWWVDRHDELPADQQGTGRPWRGARDNLSDQKGQK